MIIAIAASENHLKAPVDAHFGRCNWFCFFDSELKKKSFMENPARLSANDAGCEAARFLVANRANVAVAGRFGVKAAAVLRTNEVQMVVPDEPLKLADIIKLIK